MDGVHRAWLTVEVDSKDEARGILPPAFCADATMTRLGRFSLPQIDETLRRHGVIE